MNLHRMKNLLVELCSIRSISETAGEIDMAEKLYEVIMRMEYFTKNPYNAGIDPIKNDPSKRSCVHALMEGPHKSPKTVILLSHFDVVDIEDYGIYKDYAFRPLEYTEILKEDSDTGLPEEAKKDLNSGDYLFGRGTMDMKFGIALDVEIMNEIESKLDNFPGNILFLSVPDEENNSTGMLAAVELLTRLKEERGLEYVCCIVSEPHFPKHPGDNNKYIYTGTIGKLLPAFYCVGKETHAGEPFSGLNPNLLTSKVIEMIELNPELSDAAGSFRVPAPVCLKQSDTKDAYSVSTPAAAYAYFNFMTVSSSPDEVLGKLKILGEKAFAEVMHNIDAKADLLQALTGSKPELPSISPMVVTFRELYGMCLEAGGEKFEQHMKSFINTSPVSDLRKLSVDCVREAHKFCPYKDPMMVLFFAPPYYPHSSVVEAGGIISRIADGVIKMAKSMYGENISAEPFFPGLSDMSYLGLSGNISIDNLKSNFPLWGDRYAIPLDCMSKLNIPFINIGPLGKDAHKYTERLCISYSFDIAAKLVFGAVLSALDVNPEAFGL